MSSETVLETSQPDDASLSKLNECTSEAEKDHVTTRRDDEWYLEDGNVVLLVEDTLFKLHRFMLTRESTFFRALLSLPQGKDADHGSAEGGSDECPIICTGDSAKDFRALCWALYARPTDILAQQEYATTDIARLIRVIALSHKYDLASLETWAFSVLKKHAVENEKGFIGKCKLWKSVGRILDLATKCHRETLASQIGSEWLRRISDSSVDEWVRAFIAALDAAEASPDLREFHGKAYYTFLKATGIFITESQETLGSRNPIETVSHLDRLETGNLCQLRQQRLYRGYWSLSCLRVKLARPPVLDDDPPCSGNHARDCVPAWKAWWKGVLDDSKRSGKHLNDPGELIKQMNRRIAKSPIQTQAAGKSAIDIPCNSRIRSQISSMGEAFQKSLADRFLGPETEYNISDHDSSYIEDEE